MPSSATITAFYEFAAGDLVSSTKHNHNWGVFRGHLLPVHPTQAIAATSGTYDLGASDHRWGTLYCTDVNSSNPVGGGGGGSGIQWEDGPEAPVKILQNTGFSTYIFEPGASQELYTEIQIPSSYSAGNQIKLIIKAYSPSTSGTFLLTAQTTLIRTEVDDVESTTNQRTTTNTAITMSSSNDNEIQSIELDLTDSSGQVNSVAVSPDDILLVRLYRNTDTDTDAVRFLHKQTEVQLA